MQLLGFLFSLPFLLQSFLTVKTCFSTQLTTVTTHNLKSALHCKSGARFKWGIFTLLPAHLSAGRGWGGGKHSAFVRQSLDIRGKNTEVYNNSCVFLYWEWAWDELGKMEFMLFVWQWLGHLKFLVGWFLVWFFCGFFLYLYIYIDIYVYV